MATAADSYIGSFISLISKSEMRYEGVLFHISPQESSIGLKNVRSFGTEGRRKDGPQVVPSDKLYDYIYFRGTDIKDLQVLSSLSMQSMPAVPDDPAIIQSHYHPSTASSSLPHSNTSPMISSNAHLGLPSSSFQGTVTQNQSMGHMASWGPSTPPTVNSNEQSMPMYWQGSNWPSGSYSYLQQPSLLQSPPGLLASQGLQKMQHSPIDASVPIAAPSLHEIPHPLLPSSSASSINSAFLPPSSAGSQNSTFLPLSSAGSQNSTFLPLSSASSRNSTLLPLSSAGSQNSTLLPLSSASSSNSTVLPPSSASCSNSTVLPPSSASSSNSPVLPPSSASSLKSTSISSSVFPSILPIGHAALLETNEASSYTYDPIAPGLTLTSSLPLESSLTSSLDTNNIARHYGDKSKSSSGSNSPYPNASTSTPPIVGLSGSNHPESPTHSLVTPSQLLQSVPPSVPTITSSVPLQTAQKDIEVVQTSTLESLSIDVNEARTVLPTESVSPGKTNEASMDSQHHDKEFEQGRRNGSYGAPLHTHQSFRGQVEERKNESNGVALKPHRTNTVHARGRRNGLYGTASPSHPNNRSHMWNVEKMNGTVPRRYVGSRGRGRGRTNWISHTDVKFAEDFDFEAMNEKFNKDEVWGQLGKSIKGISEENGDADDSEEDNQQHEDGDGQLTIDLKPVYVKDEFFDSLSCHTFDHEPKKGRSKFSELKKLDAETFGRTSRGGRGGWRVGRGGWSRGSRYGRGYEQGGGRGQGRAVWSRVT